MLDSHRIIISIPFVMVLYEKCNNFGSLCKIFIVFPFFQFQDLAISPLSKKPKSPGRRLLLSRPSKKERKGKDRLSVSLSITMTMIIIIVVVIVFSSFIDYLTDHSVQNFYVEHEL